MNIEWREDKDLPILLMRHLTRRYRLVNAAAVSQNTWRCVCVLVKQGEVWQLCAPSGRLAPGNSQSARIIFSTALSSNASKRGFCAVFRSPCKFFFFFPRRDLKMKTRDNAHVLTRRLPIAIAVCVALPRPVCLPAEFPRPLDSAGPRGDKRFRSSGSGGDKDRQIGARHCSA